MSRYSDIWKKAAEVIARGSAGSPLPSALEQGTQIHSALQQMNVDMGAPGAERSALKLVNFGALYGSRSLLNQQAELAALNSLGMQKRAEYTALQAHGKMRVADYYTALSDPYPPQQALRPKPALLYHCKCCGRPVTEANPPRDQTGTACDPCVALLDNMVEHMPDLVKARLAVARLSPPKAPPDQEEYEDMDAYLLRQMRQRNTYFNNKIP